MARRHGPASLVAAAIVAFIVAFLAAPIGESTGSKTGASAQQTRDPAWSTTTSAASTTTSTTPAAGPTTGPTNGPTDGPTIGAVAGRGAAGSHPGGGGDASQGSDGSAAGAPSAAPARSLAATIARRPVYGLVIGIDPSPLLGLDTLTGAVNDANDMAAALMAFGAAPDNVRVLRDWEATGAGILSAIDQLVATAGPDATVVFSFAGHVLKLGSTTEALVAADGVLITDRKLTARFAGLGARDAWFVFEACYGGGFTELLAPGRAVTAAADADNLAYENATLGRSYLDEFVVRQGLLQSKAGGPTVQQAVAFAQATLNAERPDRQIVHYDQTLAPISLDGLERVPTPG